MDPANDLQSSLLIVIIVMSSLIILAIFAALGYFLWRRQSRVGQQRAHTSPSEDVSVVSTIDLEKGLAQLQFVPYFSTPLQAIPEDEAVPRFSGTPWTPPRGPGEHEPDLENQENIDEDHSKPNDEVAEGLQSQRL